MAGAFQLLLSEIKEWRPSVEGLAFNSLSLADSATLEVPFIEEEVFFADGFTLALWQDRWDVVKNEVLVFLVTSMSRVALREV